MLEKLLRDIDEVDTIILDTETSSLHPWKDGGILAGLAIKPLGRPATYIPIFHGNDALPGTHGTSDQNNVPISILQEIIKACKGKRLVFHNAKFDLAVLYNEGFDLVNNEFFDTMVLMRLVSEVEGSYQLKRLATKYIDPNAAKYETKLRAYIKKHKLTNYAQVPVEVMNDYALHDVIYTEWFFEYAMRLIHERGLEELLELEQDVSRCLFYVEKKGIKIDVNFVNERLAVLRPQREAAENECYSSIKLLLNERFKNRNELNDTELTQLYYAIDFIKGEEEQGNPAFNLDTHYDLPKVFHGVGITSSVLTEKGQESWSKDALKEIAKSHPSKIARNFATQISVYRALNKIIRDYYEKILEFIDKDGILHASLKQSGARTGRLSCVEPNLMNIPTEDAFSVLDEELGEEVDEEFSEHLTEVRDAFEARDDNCFLLMADWSQIELRLLADYADEQIWKKAFEYGIDVHKIAARAALGEPPEDDKKISLWRKTGKETNFAVVYGVGDKKLGHRTGKTAKEAKAFKIRYFERYPGIEIFSDKAEEVCHSRMMRVCKKHTNPLCKECDVWTTKGWVRNKWGRRRYLEGDKLYVAVNFLIQGSNADLLKDVFRRLFWKLDKTESSVVNLVHDEIITEVKYSEAEVVVPLIVNEMQTTDRFDIPIRVDLEWSPTKWGQAMSLNCKNCSGNGKIFPFDENKMIELVFRKEWNKIEEAGVKICQNCEGKGYDIEPVITHYKQQLQKKAGEELANV